MKIAVVGPGAIGCLFSALLSQAGHEVWLIDRQPGRARLLGRRGIWISGVSGEFGARVHVTSSPESAVGVGLVIIAVKSYDTAGAAETAAALVEAGTSVLTLQNGIGNIETLERTLGPEHVIGGVTAHGATLIAPGQVHHAGIGRTVIGELGGGITDRLRAAVGAFSTAGLPAEVTTDLPAALWGKLIINAGINPVATLAQVRNGAVVESSGLRRVLAEAVGEAVSVARSKGIRLPYADMVAHAEEVCRDTAGNINSMLQDVNRQRRTEVDAINGAVVREAEAVGMAAPTNRGLTDLIHGIEETYDARIAH
jgi:2-dehydropantoate 2-reductase